MVTGGIPSKLGNRYEAKWVVRQLLHVVSGQAEWLCFEGITPEYEGFEFALQRLDGAREWHQTKLGDSKKNWTIGALNREGVLRAFKRSLEATVSDKCVFVSQTGAQQLGSLIASAKLANSATEFGRALSREQCRSITELEDAWGVDRSLAFDWLRRCECRAIPVEEIEANIVSHGELLFSTDPRNIFPLLRDYLEERFNKNLTTTSVRSELRQLGIVEFKDVALDPTILENLATETEAYLRSYTPFGLGGVAVARQESNTCVELLTQPDGPMVILLTGAAGAGKSGVVRGIISGLTEQGITTLALRVDQHLQQRSLRELGEAVTGRTESPATTLRAVKPKELTVLIVDQVDALSEVSGRSAPVREAVLRLFDDIRTFKTVRLVVACRSFDLESDARLKELARENHVRAVPVAPLKWDADVMPLLSKHKIDIQAFTDKQKEFLCLPLNLSVFLEVCADGLPFVSRADLFGRLILKKQRAVANQRSLPWAVLSPLVKLASWMNDRQVLIAPESVLDEFPSACDVLATENLIVRSRNRVGFFHESFFDYVFARAFVTSQKSLGEMLKANEQDLFRRTQTRQILETLRQDDWRRYLRELSGVMRDVEIRAHIKHAVSLWLAAVTDPKLAEYEIVEAFQQQEGAVGRLGRNILFGSAGWFDLLSSNGRIESALDGADERRREDTFSWLSSIAAERPAQVAKIFEDWWGNDSARGSRLLDLFPFVKRERHDRALVDLCERLIRSRPRSEMEGRLLQRCEMLVTTWVGKDAEGASRILRALLDTWLDAHPDKHVFDRDEVHDRDLHSLKDAASKLPKAFLDGALPAFIRSMQIIADRKERGIHDYSFSIRSQSLHRDGVVGLFDLYRVAITALAKSEPKTARTYLEKLSGCRNHHAVLHLYLEAIIASEGKLGALLVSLLDEPELCEAGWDGARWKLFADAARVSIPQLEQDGKSLVEEYVLSLRRELKLASRFVRDESDDENKQRAVFALTRVGYEQLCVLETIGAENLSPCGRAALGTWRRKFVGAKIEAAHVFEASWVQSPIKRERVKYMSDKQWLKAIARYNNEREWHLRENTTGGPHELAGELQNLTKGEPARFSALIARIPDEANTTYIEHILWGLAESANADPEPLKAAVLNAHARPNKPYGRAISRLFRTHPRIADDQTYDVLAWYVRNGEASEGSTSSQRKPDDRLVTISDLLDKAGRVYVHSGYGARGDAAEALAQVLWHVSVMAPRTWPIVEARIAAESLASVRCCLISALVPLFNHDRSRCGHLVEALVSTSSTELDESARLSPLITHQGTYLLPFLIHQVPDVGRRLVGLLLNCGEPTMRLIGAWHVFGRSFSDAKWIEEADALLQDGVQHRRLAAGVAADVIGKEEFRERAEVQLLAFFSDEDADVRSQAAEVFRSIAPEEFHRVVPLAKAFIGSRAFDDNSFPILHSLDKATCDVNELVINAAARLMEDAEIDKGPGGRRGTDIHQLQNLIAKEYVASEQEPNRRKRILDVIDGMVTRGIYGVDSVLKAHERD